MEKSVVSELAEKLGVSEAKAQKVLEKAQLGLSHNEDKVKVRLEKWLVQSGWRCDVKYGNSRGIDIEAKKGPDRWIIEVKGYSPNDVQNRNSFLYVLGDLLMKMDDRSAKYSLALPDVPQYRRLWEGLPRLAKGRSCITCLFVGDAVGHFEELS